MLNLITESGLRSVVRRIKRFLRPSLHRPDDLFDFEVLGTEYGAWPVLNNSLNVKSVVYSFGIGHDISFDLALIHKFGCSIEAFDPTPRSIAWIKKQNLPEEFHIHEIGLSNKKQILRFSAPPEDKFVSYTEAMRTDSSEVISLPVEPLDALMASLGDQYIDLLKMDIEGSEYSAIADMLSKGIYPDQLCVEFHHKLYGYTNADTLKAVAALQSAGYLIHSVSPSGREYGFHLPKENQ